MDTTGNNNTGVRGHIDRHIVFLSVALYGAIAVNQPV